MQWIKDAVNAVVGEFPDSKPLQRSGTVSKEVLLDFFKHGTELFNSESFKQQLKDCAKRRGNTEGVVNESQKRIFENLGVQGDYGIRFLGQVRAEYSSDSEVMAAFYAFVQKEELTLDEAEMPPEQFAQKLSYVQRMQQQLDAQKEQLQQMTPEQRQAFVIAMNKQMLNMQTNASDQAALNAVDHVGYNQAMAPGQPGSTMTTEEQMAFFQSLSRRP